MTKRASYEYRQSLLSLGENLSTEDSKKIVHLTKLPPDMATKSPWEVLTTLDERGKANVEELATIMKDIGREDAAKKVHELFTEDRLEKVMAMRKSCENLANKIEELKEVLNREGKKRIEKELSTALENVQTLHRSLKIASGLLINENLKKVCNDHCCTSPPSSVSPSSSPECTECSRTKSLSPSTVKSTHVLRKVHKNLESSNGEIIN